MPRIVGQYILLERIGKGRQVSIIFFGYSFVPFVKKGGVLTSIITFYEDYMIQYIIMVNNFVINQYININKY